MARARTATTVPMGTDPGTARAEERPVTTRRAATKPENGNGAEPRTLAFTRAGVVTGTDFADLMSALMSDVIEGTVSPEVANAACNAGRQLLRVVEMQYRYGPHAEEQKQRSGILLAPGAAR
jgi:hypothetical protein